MRKGPSCLDTQLLKLGGMMEVMAFIQSGSILKKYSVLKM